jgi:hypothetical protein
MLLVRCFVGVSVFGYSVRGAVVGMYWVGEWVGASKLQVALSFARNS